MLVRVVHYQHDGGEPSRVFTTTLDRSRASAKDLVLRSHERWEIEVAYDEPSDRVPTRVGLPDAIAHRVRPEPHLGRELGSLRHAQSQQGLGLEPEGMW